MTKETKNVMNFVINLFNIEEELIESDVDKAIDCVQSIIRAGDETHQAVAQVLDIIK